MLRRLSVRAAARAAAWLRSPPLFRTQRDAQAAPCAVLGARGYARAAPAYTNGTSRCLQPGAPL